MTHVESDTETVIRRWMPVFITFIINVLAIGFIVGSYEMRLVNVEKHAYDKDVHMPMANKIALFVTRAEFESQTNSLIRIENKVDKISDYLMSHP